MSVDRDENQTTETPATTPDQEVGRRRGRPTIPHERHGKSFGYYRH